MNEEDLKLRYRKDWGTKALTVAKNSYLRSSASIVNSEEIEKMSSEDMTKTLNAFVEKFGKAISAQKEIEKYDVGKGVNQNNRLSAQEKIRG